jgi:carbonic anhydrase/acetyltransferase-like protein (isoleucine patch superfamily)
VEKPLSPAPMIDAQRLQRYLDATPDIHPSAFVAPNSTLVGNVCLAEEASVWFNAVLRADIQSIRVGPRSNIQDGCVVHLADDFSTELGEWVTVGHNAVLHACTLEDEVLVGMNAVILDGARIGASSIVGAGALVTGGKVFPSGSLILGSPAKVVRALSREEQIGIRPWAEKYVDLSRAYRERGLGGSGKAFIWPDRH